MELLVSAPGQAGSSLCLSSVNLYQTGSWPSIPICPLLEQIAAEWHWERARRLGKIRNIHLSCRIRVGRDLRLWWERSRTREHLIHRALCGRKRCTVWKAPHSSRCRCWEAKARLRWLPSQKKLPVVTQLFLHLNNCSQFVCKTRALKKKKKKALGGFHGTPARREMEARNALVPQDAGHTVGASSSGGFRGSSRTARALSLPLTLPVIELQWCRKESGSDALLLCQSP